MKISTSTNVANNRLCLSLVVKSPRIVHPFSFWLTFPGCKLWKAALCDVTKSNDDTLLIETADHTHSQGLAPPSDATLFLSFLIERGCSLRVQDES